MKARHEFETDKQYHKIYFSGLAMQGIMAHALLHDTPELRCECAIRMSDELLKQLKL
jgi:hypothetical protein